MKVIIECDLILIVVFRNWKFCKGAIVNGVFEKGKF